MNLLNLFGKDYKTIAIVGMEKNSGKTTTLNYLIDKAYDHGIALGITSTGRDGENMDIVTGSEKPKVFLEAGTLVSVPVKLYELSDAGLEILCMTDFSTALGQLLICRVAGRGYVQTAGPAVGNDLKKLCEDMLSLGADMVLIDGAADRRSIAAPGSSSAIILATGAVLSRDLRTVADETAHTLNLYRLPRLPYGEMRDILIKEAGKGRILIGGNEGIRALGLRTGLYAGKNIDNAVDVNTEWVFIPGAFTSSVLEDIDPQKLGRIDFILKDPTKIFIPRNNWQRLCRKGLSVKVLENITVLALSVNPYSPLGYSFAPERMLIAVKKAAGDIPVFDVMYQRGEI